jgi:hypothetical protein
MRTPFQQSEGRISGKAMTGKERLSGKAAKRATSNAPINLRFRSIAVA